MKPETRGKVIAYLAGKPAVVRFASAWGKLTGKGKVFVWCSLPVSLPLALVVSVVLILAIGCMRVWNLVVEAVIKD
jgi:hypothetical protein